VKCTERPASLRRPVMSHLCTPKSRSQTNDSPTLVAILVMQAAALAEVRTGHMSQVRYALDASREGRPQAKTLTLGTEWP